jgi:hypothetical protein
MKKFMIFFLLAAIGAVGLIGRADAAPKMGGGMQNHSAPVWILIATAMVPLVTEALAETTMIGRTIPFFRNRWAAGT